MPRVVYSLGPFLSLSKSILSKAGNSSDSTVVRCVNASEVVQRAFRQSRVS